jgi:LDH2 family malate/lactate/ureidoglycolate dehydrogenase
VKFKPVLLREFAAACFVATGVSRPQAAEIADNLVLADLRGVGSHGVTRIPIYAERLRAGVVNPKPEPKVVRSFGGLALVDGDNGPGQVVSRFANDHAIGLARAHGIGAVTVRNSNHDGILAAYTAQTAAAGLIGIATTNAPKSMAVFGGRVPILGTNPLSIALPRASGRPIVLDMATSVVARGKIVEKAKRGESIPAGWALDADGAPTTDAVTAEKGVILPFSGGKGSGLAIVVEALSGILSGGLFGAQIHNLYSDFVNPQGIGHFFLALDPEVLAEPGAPFAARVDAFADMLKASPTASGFTEILLPGEPEIRLEAANHDGIDLPENVVADLDEIADRLGVPRPTRPTDAVPA